MLSLLCFCICLSWGCISAWENDNGWRTAGVPASLCGFQGSPWNIPSNCASHSQYLLNGISLDKIFAGKPSDKWTYVLTRLTSRLSLVLLGISFLTRDRKACFLLKQVLIQELRQYSANNFIIIH